MLQAAAVQQDDPASIVDGWLESMTRTVKDRDLDAHLERVSEKVVVYGIPGKETVNYREYRERRAHEIENERLISLNYQDLRVISSTQRRIRFSIKETMVGPDGVLVILDKNIILEREDDDIWRVVEEKINSWDVKKINLAG